jgi:hypothetical protein
MAKTYEPIATYNGTGSSGTISFTSIPATYTDLILVASMVTAANANSILRLNGDSGSNYSVTNISGNGSTAASYRGANQNAVLFQQDQFSTSTAAALTIFNFLNYSNTTTNKTVLSRSSKADQSAEAHVNLWRNTAAINSIVISTGSTYSTSAVFTLYGIKAA